MSRLSYYHDLLQNMLHEVHVWELIRDESGKIKTWRLMDANPLALKSWGVTLDQVVGKKTEDIINDPTIPDLFMPIIEKIFSENKPYRWELFFEPTNQTLEMVSIPIGEFFISTGIDITERRLSQEALKTSQDWLSMALASGRMGVWDLDLVHDTAWRSLQHDQIFGYDSLLPEWGQDIFFSHVVPEDLDQVKDNFTQAFHTGNLYFECRINRADQTLAWINAEGQVFRDETNRPVRIMGVVSDITKRKLAEAEKVKLENKLLQSQKIESIGQLAGGVAHDFNNMLAVILLETEIAFRKAPPSCPVISNLEGIRVAANRSVDLTQQLLTFARKQVIAPKVVDLNETIAGTLKMLQCIIGEDIQLSWCPSANLWPVKIDPSQFSQVLTNLCVNSRDAISGVGKISIKTVNTSWDETATTSRPFDIVPGDYVHICVSDDGCGMDEKTKTHIFEPFYTTKEVGCGTGLGLATVFGAVKQSQGFITVYSEPGVGTVFNVFLPRANASVDVVAEITAKNLLCGTETILLVEDEDILLHTITTTLEESGYTVLAAATADLAQSHAKEHPGSIDLLVSDMIMPVMNGRELSVKLQSLRPEMKVLFISGYTAEIISNRGALDEGVHFLQKPFSFEALTAKVREVLDDH